nr:uncharacterized protein LOC104105929 isoform X3 [Nicotiana tomentosiformis]
MWDSFNPKKNGELIGLDMIFIDEKMWWVVCAELEIWRLLDRGEVSFATRYVSKIYVYLNVDYITFLIQKFATVSAGVQTIEHSNVNSITIEEEMFLNQMTIKELLDCDWSPELEEYIVTMREEITKIDNYFGWYYISYNACSKKIEPANGVYNCHLQQKMQVSFGEAADVSFDNLEDSDEDQHVNDGVNSRKRRNIIIDNDEFSDEDTNKCK